MKIKTKIPISREILVDMETPLSVYRKLANGPYSYLLGGPEYSEVIQKMRDSLKVE